MRFIVTMHQPPREQVTEHHEALTVSAALDRLVSEHRPGQDGSVWVESSPPVTHDGLGYVSFASRDLARFPHRSFFVKPAPVQAVESPITITKEVSP